MNTKRTNRIAPRRTFDFANHDKFFNPHVCHVCKAYRSTQTSLKLCPACRMISYCGDHHRILHSNQHGQICRAIVKLNKKRSIRNTCEITSDEWLAFRRKNIESVAQEMRRNLKPYEQQMFWFAVSCFVCHRQSDTLVTCFECLSADSCLEHNFQFFAHDCLRLRLALRENVFEFRVMQEPKMHYMYIPTIQGNIIDIESYVEQLVISTRSLQEWCIIDYIISDYVSPPLTLCFAMRHKQFSHLAKTQDTFVVHILGAACVTYRMSAWEILLHSCLYMKIVVVMIGPELRTRYVRWDKCQNCRQTNRTLCLQLRGMSYHNYVRSKRYIPPNVVIGYHLELEKLVEQTVQAIKRQHCPLLLTTKSKKSTRDYIEKIQELDDETVLPTLVVENFFRGNRSHRDHEDGGVFYRNNYLIMYQNLDGLREPASDKSHEYIVLSE